MSLKLSVTICLIPEAKGGPFIFWDDLPGSTAKAAALGYDAVELFPPEPDALNPNEVRKLLGPHKLAVSAVGSGAGWARHKLSLTNPDPAHRQTARAFVRELIDFAAELNAPVIVGSMQGRWGDGVSKEMALGYLGEAMVELGEHAAKRKQVLLYEPINRYETNLINSIDDGARFLNGLRTTSVKLLADLFHMNIEETDIAGAILSAGPLIGHVHLADSNRRPAGLGHTNFAPIVKGLQQINFNGYLGAEVLPYPSPDEAARQTVQAFRAMVGT